MKKKLIMVGLLTIALLAIWTVTVQAKTYEEDTFSITIPDYYSTQLTTDGLEAQKENGRTALGVSVTEATSNGIVITQEYVDYLAQYFQNKYGASFTLISKQLVKQNGCMGVELQYRQTESGIYVYVSAFQYISDNYMFTLMFASENQSYISSTEKKQIASSFKIKDTVNNSNGIPFTDVTKGDWYYDCVKYTYERDLLKGANDYEFRPSKNITRGMIVTILWRMEGEPKLTGGKAFSDVTSGQYYYQAVKWASSKGIVNGYNSGKFGPNDAITREQLAVILQNYAKYKGKNINKTTATSKYVDWYKVTGYARPAMQWAVATGVITGKYEGTKVDPQGTATRAEAAGMLYNYCTKIK